MESSSHVLFSREEVLSSLISLGQTAVSDGELERLTQAVNRMALQNRSLSAVSSLSGLEGSSSLSQPVCDKECVQSPWQHYPQQHHDGAGHAAYYSSGQAPSCNLPLQPQTQIGHPAVRIGGIGQAAPQSTSVIPHNSLLNGMSLVETEESDAVVKDGRCRDGRSASAVEGSRQDIANHYQGANHSLRASSSVACDQPGNSTHYSLAAQPLPGQQVTNEAIVARHHLATRAAVWPKTTEQSCPSCSNHTTLQNHWINYQSLESGSDSTPLTQAVQGEQRSIPLAQSLQEEQSSIPHTQSLQEQRSLQHTQSHEGRQRSMSHTQSFPEGVPSSLHTQLVQEELSLRSHTQSVQEGQRSIPYTQSVQEGQRSIPYTQSVQDGLSSRPHAQLVQEKPSSKPHVQAVQEGLSSQPADNSGGIRAIPHYPLSAHIAVEQLFQTNQSLDTNAKTLSYTSHDEQPMAGNEPRTFPKNFKPQVADGLEVDSSASSDGREDILSGTSQRAAQVTSQPGLNHGRKVMKRKVLRRLSNGEQHIDESIVSCEPSSPKDCRSFTDYPQGQTFPLSGHIDNDGNRHRTRAVGSSGGEQVVTRYQPSSFIRPHITRAGRLSRCSDPVTRYHQFCREWDKHKFPGDEKRRQLKRSVTDHRIRIRVGSWDDVTHLRLSVGVSARVTFDTIIVRKEQMMFEDVPRPNSQAHHRLVANNYMPPTDKKRQALRWEVRHQLSMRF